jgi:GDP-mannose 6-dehydrogenase
VSCACMADSGHEVIGVDKHAAKVDLINRGASPIVEAGLPEIISKVNAAGRLRATMATAEAVQQSQISLICVGTPSAANGSLKLDFVRKVCEEIGTALRELNRYHVVVVRSTILPGTMRSVVIPALEQASGKRAITTIRRRPSSANRIRAPASSCCSCTKS